LDLFQFQTVRFHHGVARNPLRRASNDSKHAVGNYRKRIVFKHSLMFSRLPSATSRNKHAGKFRMVLRGNGMGARGQRWAIATIDSRERTASSISGRFLLAASTIAMVAVAGSFASAIPAEAQAVAQAPASQLPPVNVTAPNEPRRAPRTAPAKRAERGSQKPRPQPARQAEQAPPLKEI